MFSYSVLSGFVLLLFVAYSLLSAMKIDGSPVRSPILRAIIGPLIIIVAGIFCMVRGLVLTMPIILLAYGEITWALAVYGLYIVFSIFPIVKINGKPISNIFVRVLLSPPLMIIMGTLQLLQGILMALPALLLFV